MLKRFPFFRVRPGKGWRGERNGWKRCIRQCALLYVVLCKICALQAETWTTPETLSAAGSGATLPAVSMNDSSQVVAGWIQGGKVTMRGGTFRGSWEAPMTHQSTYLETPLNFWLRINSSSQVLMGWGGSISQAPYGGVFSTTGFFMAGCGDVQAVNLDQNYTLPHFSQHTNHAMVVIENSSVAEDLKGGHAHFGIEWKSALIFSSNGMQANHADVAINASGYTLATWEEGAVERRVMGGVLFLEDGWGMMTPQYGRQLSASGGAAQTPRVAFRDNNRGVFVWRRFDGLNWIIQASCFELGVGWTAPVSISVAGQDASNPYVAINASSQIVAVWQRSDGSKQIIQASTLTWGGSWSTPVNLSSSGQDAALASAQINDAGQAVALWRRSNGTNRLIEAATLNFGQSWSSAVAISETGQDADTPDITLNASGQVVACWQRSDGTYARIQCSTTLLAPLPPSNLSGVQRVLKTRSGSTLFNRLIWSASTTSTVNAYKVYRNDQLVATISSSRKLLYEDYNVDGTSSIAYDVSALTEAGGESAKVRIVILTISI